MCRFCDAQKADTQVKELSLGLFTLGKREMHEMHIKNADCAKPCSGMKKKCVLFAQLSHFDVCTGYPPDVAHDIFKGLLPIELAHCLHLLIPKKYVILESLNEAIQAFLFRWPEKINHPHPMPRTLTLKKSIEGNAHENWCLLPFLPFFLGHSALQKEPAWQITLDIKDRAELVVAPVPTDQSIAFTQVKICDHGYWLKFNYLLLPKHHFVEHSWNVDIEVRGKTQCFLKTGCAPHPLL